MEEKKIIKRTFPMKRIFRKILFFIARKCPFLPGEFRALIFKLGGVHIIDPFKTFIGYDVNFDDITPENILVKPNSIITEGVKILTHFVDPEYDDFNHMWIGNVEIGSNVFLGMNVIVVKPVKIGDGAIVGANSVINKDIPSYTIWGGNPASFIKNREIKK